WRGVLANCDYLTNPIDAINGVSGSLHIEVPLASLPPGRADFGFDLNLVYDSHLYDIDMFDDSTVLRSNLTTGGWTYNLKNFKLDREQHNSADCQLDQTAFRIRVGLADGSLHVMHLREGYSDRNGFSAIDLDGKRSLCATLYPQAYPNDIIGTLNYYSTDSTFMKLEIPADGTDWTQKQWNLYLPDGRRIMGK